MKSFQAILIPAIFLSLLLVLTQCSQEQKSCKNSKSFSVVGHQRMNVLYKGMENPVNVAVPGYCAEDIKVSLTNGELTKKSPGQYSIVVNDHDQTRLSIVANVDQKDATKQIGEKQYRVKSLPHAMPAINGKTSGAIKLSKVKAAEKLEAEKPKGLPLKDTTFSIEEYRWTYVPAEGKVIEGTPEEAAFDSTLNKIVKNRLGHDDRILMDQIKVKGPAGVRKVPMSVNLRIKRAED